MTNQHGRSQVGLVPSNKTELDAIMKALSEPRQQSLLKQLYLTALNAKVELDEHLNQEFLKEFGKQPVAAIEAVFAGWRRTSNFMPGIADLTGLFAAWLAAEDARREMERRTIEKLEQDRRVASGESQFGLGDVVTEFRRVIEAKTELSPERKKELAEKVEQLRKGMRTA